MILTLISLLNCCNHYQKFTPCPSLPCMLQVHIYVRHLGLCHYLWCVIVHNKLVPCSHCACAAKMQHLLRACEPVACDKQTSRLGLPLHKAHSSTAISDGWGPKAQSCDVGIDISESRDAVNVQLSKFHSISVMGSQV